VDTCGLANERSSLVERSYRLRVRTAWVAALCLALLVGCTGSSGTGPDPSELIGSWKLIDLQGFNGTAHTAPDAAFTLRFYPSGWVAAPCGSGSASTRVDVSAGTMQVDPGWRSRSVGGCPELAPRLTAFLVGKVLTGTTAWKIHNDTLTLSHNGAAALFQHVGTA
jgi:hypothetical protein